MKPHESRLYALRPGASGQPVLALKELLYALPDVQRAVPAVLRSERRPYRSDRFDETAVAAVSFFQKRQGLPVSGEMTPETWAALGARAYPPKIKTLTCHNPGLRALLGAQTEQSPDECRRAALLKLAEELKAREDLYPSDSRKLWTILTTALSGARIVGGKLGPVGGLLGFAGGASVGVFINDSAEAKVESIPVKNFYERVKPCDRAFRRQANEAARRGPSIGPSTRLQQMFVVTKQSGVFALYPFTVKRGPTLVGDYIIEDHGANPTDPVHNRGFGR